MKHMIIAFFSLFLPAAALAAPGDIDFSKGCKTNPSLSGPCFRVHGRLRAYNGAPDLRLWPVGTKRLLGVVGTEGDYILLPDEIRNTHLGGGKSMFGDFEVCPFEDDEPGVMRPVCIESVSNFVLKPTR